MWFFSPLYHRLLRTLKKPEVCALLTILLILIIFVAPLFLITFAVVSEAKSLADEVQLYITNILNHPDSGNKLHQLFLSLRQHAKLDELLASNTIQQLLGGNAQFIMSNTLNLLGGAMGLVFTGILILFTMYYLFRDHALIAETLPRLIPMERSQSLNLLHRTQEIINASVYGVLVIAVVQGILGGLMFWFLGIQSALVWGVIMVFLSLIPMLGAFIIWLPAALILLLTGHWAKCLILVVWGTAVIGMADNLLRPRLVGKKTHMHELMIFFSVMGGLQVFGLLGILLGPVVLSVSIALLEAAGGIDAARAPDEPDPLRHQ